MRIFLQNVGKRVSIFLILGLISAGNAFAATHPPKLLFLYHPQQDLKKEDIFNLPDRVFMLTNLLGHFKPEISHVPINEYFQGLAQKYDFVFYLGEPRGGKVPEALLEDIPKYPKVTFVWLRWNVEQFLKLHGDEYGFQVSKPHGGFVRINYNHQVYPRADTEMIAPIQITDWEKVETNGILENPSAFTAFSARSKNLWYFPDQPYYQTAHLVFSDLLHKVFRMPHPVQQRFFIRLEDIHPFRDPAGLRDNCKALEKAKVPFMMAVSSQYRKPGHETPVYLKDKPHLIRAIKECAQRGGSIVLHGVTHQYRDETGEGHEFWDIHADKPIPEYTESHLHERIDQGIETLARLGLYPIAWETPHYAASREVYRVISQHFSTVVEMRQISNETYKVTQTFPFIVEDIYGQTVVPENLGYINFETGETIEKKLNQAKRYKIVQDALVGVFYHPYYEAKYLAGLVQGLKDLGFAPFDLRDLPGVVLSKNVAVFSGIDRYELVKPTEKMRTLDGDAKILKVSMGKEWLHTFLVNYRYQPYEEQWSREKIGGDAVVRIPDKSQSLFVIEKTDWKPSAANRLERLAKEFILGETSGPIETFQRWIIWSLFGATLVFFIFILRILIARTSYHSSHYRKND